MAMKKATKTEIKRAAWAGLRTISLFYAAEKLYSAGLIMLATMALGGALLLFFADLFEMFSRSKLT
jgi:hypothetical protein